MGKLKEIWAIVKRRDFKDGEEVHVVEFNGGLMLSNQLYEKLKPEFEAMPDTKSWSAAYGLKIISTPYLPYIYRKVKKGAKPPLN